MKIILRRRVTASGAKVRGERYRKEPATATACMMTSVRTCPFLRHHGQSADVCWAQMSWVTVKKGGLSVRCQC